MPEFLKTGLAKDNDSFYYLAIKNNKMRPKADKSLYLTLGSKLMVLRSIPKSRSLKRHRF